MAGIADRTLALKLVTDVGDINKQMKGVTGGFKKMGSAAKSWGKAFAGSLVIGGLEALPGLIDGAFKGFKAGEDAIRNLGLTWKNLDLDPSKLQGFIDTVSDLALDLGFDDAEILGVFDTFIQKTGDANKALGLTEQVMDLVRGKGWSIGRAVKFVTKNMDDLDGALDANRGKAEAWANEHPLEVTAGKISDEFDAIIGALSEGRFEDAMKSALNVGGLFEDLLFGEKKTVDLGSGMVVEVRAGGLIGRMVEIGGKLVDGVIEGMATLGTRVQSIWDTEVATVDWLKAITDGLANVWTAITADPKKTGDVATAALAVGGVFATAMFTVKLLGDALAAVMGAPEFLIGKGVKGAGNAIGMIFRGAMFSASMLARGLVSAAGLIKEMPGVLGAARVLGKAIGTALQVGLIAGITFGLVLLLQEALQGAAKAAFPGWLNDLIFPQGGLPGAREMGGPARGMTLVGEGGPELLRLPAGSRVFSNPDSRSMLGQSGGDTTVNINVTVQAGIGDPVAIGREVDRVLRVYRKRAGILTGGSLV